MIEKIKSWQSELAAIRQDLHRHPELGLDTFRTSKIVESYLRSLGIETHRVGGTGVVGVLRGGGSNRSVGLRADMDALAIYEATGLPYSSTESGLMHACGHDGHTTMLLGAARYLSETGAFEGTVNLIFQPGEEGFGGALEMINDGLFDRFPCDSVFAMHNAPGLDLGRFRIAPGTIGAGGGYFDITVEGVGAHGAAPETGRDPVLAVAAMVPTLQQVVARNVAPLNAAVVSVTRLEGGAAYNVIPEAARLGGTMRYFTQGVGELINDGINRVAKGVAEAHGCTATVDLRILFTPLVNDPEMTLAMTNSAVSLVGEGAVYTDRDPSLGSEDFSFMAEKVPGAYIQVGNGDCAELHSPTYDFNDGAIAYGAALYAKIAQDMTQTSET